MFIATDKNLTKLVEDIVSNNKDHNVVFHQSIPTLQLDADITNLKDKFSNDEEKYTIISNSHFNELAKAQDRNDFLSLKANEAAALDAVYMLKISLGYPDAATEKELMFRSKNGQLVDKLRPVTHMDSISAIQHEIRDVFIGDPVADYLLGITRATREHPAVILGASPRATLSFMNAVKAYAFLQQRDYVLPDDVKTLAPYVLSHRIMLRPESRLENATTESVLQFILRQVKVPVQMGR